MIGRGRLSAMNTGGLRTRYTPTSRIGQGLISAVPWINVLLLVFMFMLLDRQVVLRPGCVIELPRAPFTGGLRSDLIVVVRSVASVAGGARTELAYFNDQPFHVGNEEQMTQLRSSIFRLSNKSGETGLVIYADRNVDLVTVVRIMEMAREIGLERVNLATSPAQGR